MRIQLMENGQLLVTIKDLELSYIAANQEEAIEKAWELSNEKSNKIN
ncbi:MAG: hypothetical protein WBG30_05580 [Psychrilyobacter sp.]